MTAQFSKSEIILKLYSRLKQSPCTIAILEDWKKKNGYTFSNRSLYRYLDELAAHIKVKGERIEIYKGEFNKKTWKLCYNKSTSEFTMHDVHTFYLSKLFIPTDILLHRRKSFNKIEEKFYQQINGIKQELAADAFNLNLQHSNFYQSYFSPQQLITIDLLIWAIQNKRKLIIESLATHVDETYNNFKAGHTILPLTLQYHRGTLQLCAYNEATESIAIIAFDTVATFTPTNEIFNVKKYAPLLSVFYDRHFGISPNINGKCYKIELEFFGSTGGFIQNFFWHNTQHFTQLKNGNTLMTINCGINRELVGWIFQWMNNVKVRQPAVLKNMVCDVYKHTLSNYEDMKQTTYKNHFVK